MKEMKRKKAKQMLHSASFTAALASKRGDWRGRLVCSVAGRDMGRYYLVLADSEDGFIWLADGRSRPVDQPKRKNVRHVQRVNAVAADWQHRADGKDFTNEEIRAAIAQVLKVKEGE